MTGEAYFLELDIAARRLNLDAGDMAEAILSATDAGFSSREAATMTIIEMLQRRGVYCGRLKQAVDDGTIFSAASLSEKEPESWEGLTCA